MQILKRSTFIILGILIFTHFGLAQVYYPGKNDINPNQSAEERQRMAVEQQERALEIRDNIISRIKNSDSTVDFKKPQIEKSPEEIKTPEEEAERNKEMEEFKKAWLKTKSRLLPPQAYYTKFSHLLKDTKMNLSRLFVDKNCDEGKTVTIEEIERCTDVIPIEGGGAFYSFRFKANYHPASDWWDIHFINNKFIVGNETVQSIISEIGDVDLENINPDSEELKLLNNYKPLRTLPDIKERNKLLENGFKSGKFTYSISAPIKLNSTYIVRSIAYKLKKIRTKRDSSEGKIDITLAFKVVGIEKDQSAIILWKELKSKVVRRKLNS